MRRALGASQWRVARQLLTESLLLAIAGTSVGVAIATWASRLIVSQLSMSFVSHVALDLSINSRVLAFTSAVSIVTAVLFGTVPALRAMQASPIDAMKEHGTHRAETGGSSLAGTLVVAQVALSLVLVVAAGLFLRTFAQLVRLPLGFDQDRVLIVDVGVARAPIAPGARTAFFGRLADALAALPGVASAGGSLVTPMSGGYGLRQAIVDGAPAMTDSDRIVAVNYVTPGWFAAYGIPIRSGRDIDVRDAAAAAPVMLVNETFARRFLRDRPIVGARAVTPTPGSRATPQSRTIVGVVADARYRSVREPAPPTMYFPLAQWDLLIPFAGGSLSVRAAQGAPELLARETAAALTKIDPNLEFQTHLLVNQIDSSLTQERLVAMLS
ncbi:MAG: FtsX-like permease family protein, partial [Acidobacteriia bacterium]|nr:FtsX-like permease family protein [Terriglobia bacterium]